MSLITVLQSLQGTEQISRNRNEVKNDKNCNSGRIQNIECCPFYNTEKTICRSFNNILKHKRDESFIITLEHYEIRTVRVTGT